MGAPAVCQFGDIKVDAGRAEVTRGGAAVPLEPKAFDVLLYLIEHRDRLATKEELLDAVWKDTFVTPNVLTRAIAQLRKALGDDAAEARYIKTVARRGYRFSADVQVLPQVAEPFTQPVDDTAPPAAAITPRPGSKARYRALAVAILVLTAAGVAVYRTRSTNYRPTITGLQRVTMRDDAYSWTALSPDGHRLAYSLYRSGAREIYVRGIAEGAPETQLTTTGRSTEPAWSRDGLWIAYRADNAIWIVSATGGAPMKVADGGMNPYWGPDGRLVYAAATGTVSQGMLWTVNRDGTGARPLTEPGHPKGQHAHPTWSHDGRLIAFLARYGEGGTGIYVVPANGGEPRHLGTWTNAGWTRFSPNDRTLFFTGPSPDGGGALLFVPVGAAGQQPSTPQLALPLVGGPVISLSIANDGTATVIIAHADPSNIWIVDAPSAATSSEPYALTSDSVRNELARFSPNGKRIGFSQTPGGGPPATAWLMDADGKNVEPLSPGTLNPIQAPQFSRDGTRVLVAIDREPQPTLAWITLSTRQMTPIVTDWWPTKQRLRFPVLSPGNDEVAYHLSDAKGVLNVWRLPLGPGKGRQITFDQESASFPFWSPDGKWLAVSVKRGANSFLGVVSSNGGDIEPLTAISEMPQGFSGGWAPDGDQIAFAAMENRIWNIYAVSRRSKQVRRVTNFIETEGNVITPSWSPKGDKIIFERTTPAASTIWTFKIASR